MRKDLNENDAGLDCKQSYDKGRDRQCNILVCVCIFFSCLQQSQKQVFSALFAALTGNDNVPPTPDPATFPRENTRRTRSNS